jgi:hypothetical protein
MGFQNCNPIIYPPAGGIATLGDAEHALKTIAVAEAAEKIWMRAKDATKLFAAIKAKLHHQAAFHYLFPDIAERAAVFDEAAVPHLPTKQKRLNFAWQSRQIELEAGVNPYARPNGNGAIGHDG